jgi:DNA mismatch endonuclease, patch repair protein
MLTGSSDNAGRKYGLNRGRWTAVSGNPGGSVMLDKIDRLRRSANMAAIRGRDTGPELAVRRSLRSLGIGYRLHVRGMPGRPDIVMQGRRAVIFVHGCFWHRHEGCRFAASPKSRVDFWQKKFADNVARDHKNETRLRDGGWRVLVVWECDPVVQILGRY